MTDWAGNERSSTVFHVDYGKVEQIVATLSDRLGASRPDAVVGIVRAGVVPATMFAQRLGAELHLLRLQRHRRQCEWLGSAPPAGAKVLLVDDIVSRGSTMHRAHAMLVDQGYVVRTAALYVDRRRAEFTPDCALDAPGFIRFSWDRRETTPEARALIASDTEALPPQRETESFGVDMDGVLLPDIRKPHYRKNLALSLSRRQRLAPFTNQALPAIDWQRAHIVTGRPQDDFEATRE
ncbi:MAG: phosphoribosyltransferase family protein, partial [Quisquiliibacterium sp.]